MRHPEDEEDTGRINAQVALFAKLCHVFERLPPRDQLAFVEMADQLLEIMQRDRDLVFCLVSRLVRQ